jgi:hypothetical protein
MPHFSSIPTERRDKFYDQIQTLLWKKFTTRRYVLEDVRWRNLGIYRGSDGLEVPVFYDLETVREYSEEKDMDWVEMAMKNLYNLE